MLRRISPWIFSLLALTACTIGIVEREQLAPGASVLPTPDMATTPITSPQSLEVTVQPTSTPQPDTLPTPSSWPLPTVTPFAPLIIAGRANGPAAIEAQSIALIGQIAVEHAMDVAVSGNYAYVADADVGLRIVDLSAAMIVGSLPTYVDRNPGLGKLTSGGWPTADTVKIQGAQAYVAGGNGLSIIDVANPAAPTELSHIAMNGVFAVAPRYLYFAAEEKVCVVDIADPRYPTEMGCVSIDSGMPLDIAVAGNYVYVVDGEALHILDVSNYAPTPVHTYNLDFAFRVDIAGRYAYVVQNCEYLATPCNWNNVALSIFDISDPYALVHAGAYYPPGDAKILDVSVKGPYAYLTFDGLSTLQIVDVSEPAAPVLAGYDRLADKTASAIAVQDALIYVAAGDAGLLIFRFAETAHGAPAAIAANGPISGRWFNITTAEGLCTDWPLLIGSWYIGVGDNNTCHSLAAASGLPWSNLAVPAGQRIIAVSRQPGQIQFVTDAGLCYYNGVNLQCEASSETIQAATWIWNQSTPVYVSGTVIRNMQQSYDIAGILEGGNAQPIWIVAGNMESGERIWAGTNGYGVIAIKPDTGEIVQYTTADGLPGNSIRDITAVPVDHFGYFDVIWAATDQGIGRWDGVQWRTYTTADGLPSNDIRGVSANRDDTIWAATAGGAAYFDGQTWHAFTRENGLPEGDLNGVQALKGGEVWFSTRGNGLLVFVPTN